MNITDELKKLNYFAWLLCLLTVLFGGLHGLTVVANQVNPPRLSTDALLALTIVFFIALIIWLSMFLMRLAETDIGSGGRTKGSTNTEKE